MFPDDPRRGNGMLPPLRTTPGMGPETRSWLVRQRHVSVPMGPRSASGAPPFGVVFTEGYGCNVWDADHNRYVDLAAGFGSLLLGHSHPYVVRALELQGAKLLQAMGDLYASDARIGLSTQLSELFPEPGALVMLGQSGADVVSAALKSAMLATGKPGVVAFEGAYHGLSYGPLAACGLRESYRLPFDAQLNPHVHFLPSPRTTDDSIAALQQVFSDKPIGAVLFEPILGRGGVMQLPDGWLSKMYGAAREAGVVTIADEIWTGLGRSGAWLASVRPGGSAPLEHPQAGTPDLICLGKGLGGGVPISALVGRAQILRHWSREREVVHTSTFAGAPLACATAVATLDVLRRFDLVDKSRRVGESFTSVLQEELAGLPVAVRGQGLMIGVDLGDNPGAAFRVMAALLQDGYIVSTGGTSREVVVITPPLVIDEGLLLSSVAPLRAAIEKECVS